MHTSSSNSSLSLLRRWGEVCSQARPVSRALRAVAAGSLVVGCAALPTPVVLDQQSFAGMYALVNEEAPGRPLHVLLVHGMGTPTPNGFDAFIASLASRFDLVQIPPAELEPQWQGCQPETPAQPTLIQPKPEPIDNTAVFQRQSGAALHLQFRPKPECQAHPHGELPPLGAVER